MIYESTVHPGATEEVCIPALERASGMKWKAGFHVGYHPEDILAGRRINDGMSAVIAQQTVKQMIRTSNPAKGSRVIVLGITFKENYPDLRNSKAAELVRELRDFGFEVSGHDPASIPESALHEYGIALTE